MVVANPYTWGLGRRKSALGELPGFLDNAGNQAVQRVARQVDHEPLTLGRDHETRAGCLAQVALGPPALFQRFLLRD